MKTIELTPTEYINFRKIFKSKFNAEVYHGMIIITAQIQLLEQLGY